MLDLAIDHWYGAKTLVTLALEAVQCRGSAIIAGKMTADHDMVLSAALPHHHTPLATSIHTMNACFNLRIAAVSGGAVECGLLESSH